MNRVYVTRQLRDLALVLRQRGEAQWDPTRVNCLELAADEILRIELPRGPLFPTAPAAPAIIDSGGCIYDPNVGAWVLRVCTCRLGQHSNTGGR